MYITYISSVIVICWQTASNLYINSIITCIILYYNLTIWFLHDSSHTFYQLIISILDEIYQTSQAKYILISLISKVHL